MDTTIFWGVRIAVDQPFSFAESLQDPTFASMGVQFKALSLHHASFEMQNVAADVKPESDYDIRKKQKRQMQAERLQKILQRQPQSDSEEEEANTQRNKKRKITHQTDSDNDDEAAEGSDDVESDLDVQMEEERGGAAEAAALDNIALPSHLRAYDEQKEKSSSPFGCILRFNIFDDVAAQTKKFVIAHFSTRLEPRPVTNIKLNHHFDSDQLQSLVLEVTGKPQHIHSDCTVYVCGAITISTGVSLEQQQQQSLQREADVHQAIKELFKPRELSPEELLEKQRKRELEKRKKKIKKSKKREGTTAESDSEEEAAEETANGESEVTYAQLGDPNHPAYQKVRTVKDVHITDLITGHGRKAKPGDEVSIHYKGKLDPDKRATFDKTNKKPFTFILGSKKVIEGINIGVEGMTLNCQRELIIPPSRGFGKAGIEGKVPSDSALYYDITLVGLVSKRDVEREVKRKQRAENEKRKRKLAKQKSATQEKEMLGPAEGEVIDV